MINKEFQILLPDGLHARPATALLKLVRQYKSVVKITKSDKEIQLNSMLNLLSMAIKFGDTITISMDGDDEVALLEALDNYFENQLTKSV